MKRRVTTLTFACLLGIGTLSPGIVGASCGGNGAGQVADALLVRPPMLAVSLVTTAIYLATSPLTFLMDIDQEAGDVLVSAPWWFTSGRCLGHFDETPCESVEAGRACTQGALCCS